MVTFEQQHLKKIEEISANGDKSEILWDDVTLNVQAFYAFVFLSVQISHVVRQTKALRYRCTAYESLNR